MKVAAAAPGDILISRGLVPKPYTRNLSEEELHACQQAGFIPGFLMPTWIGRADSNSSWEQAHPLFYVGPVWLDESVGGLRKHHVFLFEGRRIALSGYDFRHLEPHSVV